MTTTDHNTSRKAWLLLGLLLGLGVSACTREDANNAGERMKRGAERAYEKLPPASEVREDLKHAGKTAGEAMRHVADNVKREARETRDLLRERTRDSEK